MTVPSAESAGTPEEEKEASLPRGFATALATSAVLGILLIPSRGSYSAEAMALVFAALGFVVYQLYELVRDRRGAVVPAANVERAIAISLIAFTAGAIFDSKLIPTVSRSMWVLRAIAAFDVALLGTYFFDHRLRPGSRWPIVRFALFALGIAVAVVEVVRISPAPAIDVWTVQTNGARALLGGRNPFGEVRSVDTAPGIVRDDVPYVYPPLHAMLTVPAELLGDVRYTMGAALLALGWALRDIALGSRKKLSPLLVDAAPLAVWLAPKIIFIVNQSWIDPVQIALIAGSTALALRKKTWAAAVGFGLVLAAKQTMFWVAPLAYVAFPAFRPRHAAAAVALAAAFYVPFALWDWPAFLHANVGFLSKLPTRDDALSFVNWGVRALGVHIPYGIAFPLAGSVVGWVVLRRRASVQAFGVALLATYFVFFTLNKWTFANYYFSLGGMAALAAVLALYDEGHGPRANRALRDAPDAR